MKNKKVFFVAILTLLLCSCNKINGIPNCSSKTTEDTLISLIKEQVVGNKNSPWYLIPNFNIINTNEKNETGYKCNAEIIFSTPKEWQNQDIKKINIDYFVQKNEASPDSFSVRTSYDFEDIKSFNYIAWTYYQTFLYKMSGLDFLLTDENKKTTQSIHNWIKNPSNSVLAFTIILQLPNINEITYSNIQSKLEDLGWKHMGSGEINKDIEIFEKDNYKLDLKTVNFFNMNIVDLQDSAIWEKNK